MPGSSGDAIAAARARAQGRARIKNASLSAVASPRPGRRASQHGRRAVGASATVRAAPSAWSRSRSGSGSRSPGSSPRRARTISEPGTSRRTPPPRPPRARRVVKSRDSLQAMPASAKTASSAPSRSEIFQRSQRRSGITRERVLGRAQQLVLAGKLLAQVRDAVAADGVGPSHVVVHVDGDVLAERPALERHQPGEHELRSARSGQPAPRRRGCRPPVPVAAEEAARVPELDLVLAAPPRVRHESRVSQPKDAPRRSRLSSSSGTQSDARGVALHPEVARTWRAAQPCSPRYVPASGVNS